MLAYKTVVAKRFEDGAVKYFSIHTHLRNGQYQWQLGKRHEGFLTACSIPEAALHYAQSYLAPEDGIALLECEVEVLDQHKHELTCSAITPLRELPFVTHIVHKRSGDGPHMYNSAGERVERWFLPWPETK